MAVIPAPGNGADLPSVLVGAAGGDWHGVAFLHNGARSPELFKLRDGYLLWTREGKATQAERLQLRVSLGVVDPELAKLALAALGEPAATEPAAGGGETSGLRVYSGSDDANARLFIQQHGGNVRYCPQWNTFMVWDDKRWRIDNDLAVKRLVAELPQLVYQAAANCATPHIREQIVKVAHKLEHVKHRENMLKAVVPHITVTPAALDQHLMLLNCQKGTLDLRTGELRQHDRADFLTTTIDIEFNPHAQATTWERFITDIFADDRVLARFVQCAVGYSRTW